MSNQTNLNLPTNVILISCHGQGEMEIGILPAELKSILDNFDLTLTDSQSTLIEEALNVSMLYYRSDERRSTKEFINDLQFEDSSLWQNDRMFELFVLAEAYDAHFYNLKRAMEFVNTNNLKVVQEYTGHIY